VKSRKYFSKSAEEKSEYAIHTDKAGGINRGWVAMQGESLDPEGTKVSNINRIVNIHHSFLHIYFIAFLLYFSYTRLRLMCPLCASHALVDYACS
jgi:hypothetical protein